MLATADLITKEREATYNCAQRALAKGAGRKAMERVDNSEA